MVERVSFLEGDPGICRDRERTTGTRQNGPFNPAELWGRRKICHRIDPQALDFGTGCTADFVVFEGKGGCTIRFLPQSHTNVMMCW